MLKRFYFTFFLSTLGLLSAWEPVGAQTGPGGVGAVSASNLRLWLDAQTGVTLTGGVVSGWDDRSSMGLNLTQGTAARCPGWPTNVANGRSVIRFDGTDDNLFRNNVLGSDLFSAANNTIFFVMQGSGTGAGLWFRWNGTRQVLFERNAANARFAFYDNTAGSGRLDGATSVNAAFRVVSGLKNADASNAQRLYINGALDVQRNHLLSLDNLTATAQLSVGAAGGGGTAWSGDIGEVIVYNTSLNEAERRVVENYLGAKYGIPVANDYFSNTVTVGATGYNYNVIGILRLADGQEHTLSTGGGLTLAPLGTGLVPTGAQTHRHAFAGHNNVTSVTAVNTFLAGTSVTSRWSREFWMEKHPDASITMSFDMSALGLPCLPSNNPADYFLLTRDNPSDNFTEITDAVSISGNTITFNYHADGITGAYYTIGYNTSTPTLYSFATNCNLGPCNWESASSWTTDPTGLISVGSKVPCASDNVVILNGHHVQTTANGAQANSVTIQSGGRLSLGTTTGHNFTTLAGAGTLSLSAPAAGTAVFPTVTTNTFLTTAGSTVDYTGTTSYNLPSTPAAYQNLIISGGLSSTKTLTANYTAAGNFTLANLTSLQVGTFNFTVSGTSTISGTLADNNIAGTTSFQNLIMTGGTINGTNAVVVNVAGTLSVPSGTATIGQTAFTVTGNTTIAAGATLTFTSNIGTKTFGNILINGGWVATGNPNVVVNGNFTINAGTTFTSGTGNYTFAGVNRVLDGGVGAFTMTNAVFTGTYTNNIPVFNAINITVNPGGKITNASAIVPPTFMGFNTTRTVCWGTDVSSASNNAGNSISSIASARDVSMVRAGGTLYTLRSTDLQTAATPTTRSPIIVQFTAQATGASTTTTAATFLVGSGFADNATIHTGTARLTFDTDGNNLAVVAGTGNSGNHNNAQTYFWIINPTGAALTYRRPNANLSETVGANSMDLWRGNVSVADEMPVTTAGGQTTDFKILYHNGTGTINFTNIIINPIDAPQISGVGSTYCTSLTSPSLPFTVNYNMLATASTGTHFNAGNVFTVQLSDAVGSFANPTAIGTLTSTALSGTITCAIPANRQGTAFRLRVVSSAPGLVGPDNGSNIVINGYRTSPTLPQVLPVGGTGTTLSITNFSGGAPSPTPTAYQWAYRIIGSNVIIPIAGATSPTYAPAPPLTSVSNTYYVFCILTVPGCGTSYSDAVQISVNCSVTANLVTNGNFSGTSVAYPPVGTMPAGHVLAATNTGRTYGFATEYGWNPGTPGVQAGFESATVINCSANRRETCSMFPETSFAVSYNPRNHHTNFCDLRVTTDMLGTTRTGSISTTASGNNLVVGTGTNFAANLVGSVITMDYAIASTSLSFGTLSHTNGSPTITRTGGSAFTTALVGSYLIIGDAGTGAGARGGRVIAVPNTTTLTLDRNMDATGTNATYRFEHSNERQITQIISATQLRVDVNFNATDAYFATNASTRNYRYIHGSRTVGGSGGRMVTINAATVGTRNIWQQNVVVTPNTNYVFSFNAINLNNASALQFGVFFDCYQIGANIDNPAPELCRWARYSVQWNSGASTTVSLSIRNIAAFAAGNDMAIDDIEFYACTDPVSYPPGEQFVWRGLNTNWFDPDNWGSCNPPTCNNDITIPVVGVGRVYPVISAGGAVARSVQIDAGASLTINANRNLDVCGNLINNGTLVADIASTVTFISGLNPQQVIGNFTGASAFGSLIVNKTATGNVLRFDSDIDIERDFTITSGTVNGNLRTIRVGRHFTNAANGVFNANGSTVVFNGNANQNFTNNAAATSCEFANVTMNQSLVSTLSLNHNLVVNNVLTLTSGRIIRAGAAGTRLVDVRNNAAAAIVGHNGNSYVVTTPYTADRLILRRSTANAVRTYDFPVGDAVNFQNVRLEITTGLGAAVTHIDGFFTNTTAGGSLSDNGCLYAPCTGGYWSLNPNTTALATNAQYNVELFPVGFACMQVCPTNPITIAKGSVATSTWELGGSTYTSPYKRSGFTSFTDFVPIGGIQILPVTMVRFDVTLRGKETDLYWVTTSEIGSSHFNVQRSTDDGRSFESIGRVQAAGNTSRIVEYRFTDRAPRSGVNYYRLEQVDADGKIYYSKVIAVTLAGEMTGKLTVYPNPTNTQTLYLDVPARKGDKMLLSVTDILGKQVYNELTEYGGSPYALNLSLPNGMYIVTVAIGNQVFHEKVEYLNR